MDRPPPLSLLWTVLEDNRQHHEVTATALALAVQTLRGYHHNNDDDDVWLQSSAQVALHLKIGNLKY
jgi:hypothetical protein